MQTKTVDQGLTRIGNLLLSSEATPETMASTMSKLNESAKISAITGKPGPIKAQSNGIGPQRGNDGSEIRTIKLRADGKRVVVIQSAIGGIRHLATVSSHFSPAATLVADQTSFDTGLPTGWLPPAVVTGPELEDAQRQLPKAEELLARKPDEAAVEKWLSTLGIMTKSAKSSEHDIEVIVKIYARMLRDYPAQCFSDAMLDKATDRFSFFPSVAELKALLGEEKHRLEKYRDRLAAIIRIGEGR